MIHPPARPAVVESAPSGLDRFASSGVPWRAGAGVRAVLVAFLAWAALVCAGLGGTVGTVSHTLASKLAASAQHLQRQGGASLSSRAARAEHANAVAGLSVAEVSSAIVEGHADGAVAALGVTPAPAVRRSDLLPPAAAVARPDAPYRLPPSRAPPLLA